MADVYTFSQLQELMNPVFSAYDVQKAVLFGSYGKGTASTNSDIDLLVDSRLHGLHFVGLLGDLKNRVGKEIDLFDITHIVPGSRIDKEIHQTGVTLYEK